MADSVFYIIKIWTSGTTTFFAACLVKWHVFKLFINDTTHKLIHFVSLVCCVGWCDDTAQDLFKQSQCYDCRLHWGNIWIEHFCICCHFCTPLQWLHNCTMFSTSSTVTVSINSLGCDHITRIVLSRFTQELSGKFYKTICHIYNIYYIIIFCSCRCLTLWSIGWNIKLIMVFQTQTQWIFQFS